MISVAKIPRFGSRERSIHVGRVREKVAVVATSGSYKVAAWWWHFAGGTRYLS
jgi:hypothetical protein